MSTYRLLKHKDYDRVAETLPPSIRRKALWAQVLLGTRGRTPNVKGTTGLNARWRRTPVQGNHYYMWWIPNSESGIDSAAPLTPSLPASQPHGEAAQTILVHSIRHHDETDDPLDLGSLTDYEEVPIASLDPRYEEQTAVSERMQHDDVALATVMGLPGSGKTVSLLYLVRDLAQRTDLQKLLYITYTSRLKRAAQEFLQAQGDELAQKVRVATLGEIERQLTKMPAQHEPFGELERFIRFINLPHTPSLGPWKRFPQTLFTELRAHLLGKLFPADYQLPHADLRELITYDGGLNPAAYAAMRGLDRNAAEIACRLAVSAQNEHFFQDQLAANHAIGRLQKGKSPHWLAEIDGLVIDEVQDLTLVQIAMVGEMVRERMRRRNGAPFAFVVAGDESQIVQPSGFDWGVTKNLLGEQMETWPEEFEFAHQRRSPRNLAQLIDHSWRFYGKLPKGLRPSGRRQAFIYETVGVDATDEGNGQLFLCAPRHQPDDTAAAAQRDWQELLDELVNTPGRVIVDLTETLRGQLRYGTAEETAESDEVIFLPREIKGLERSTVLIYGLNALYERADLLCQELSGDLIGRLEARRLFDEMRVALSRSTDRLVIMESAEAAVLKALAIHEIPGVLPIRWPDLIETLQTEELSAIEVIEGYLDEVDDLFERGMWAQGYRRNRRAYDLAVQLEDHALQREAEVQQIEGHLQEAAQHLAAREWHTVQRINRHAATLAATFGDPLLIDQVADQYAELNQAIGAEVQTLLESARNYLAVANYRQAQAGVSAAETLVELTADTALQSAVDEVMAALAWRWAAQLLDQDNTPETVARVIALFETAANVMQRQADSVGAQVMDLLAQRYHELPPRPNLSKREVIELLARTQRYLHLVRPLHLAEEGYLYVQRWLDELFGGLHSHADLYYSWALLAQEFAAVADYPLLDEHLWELENELDLLVGRGRQSPDEPIVKRFRAFVAAYNEAPAQASLLWEELGELDLAFAAARSAGDLERAYTLARQAKLPIPEDLAVTVKATRLLHQLHQKHHGLYPAERQALLDLLATLQATVAADLLPEDGAG